MSFDYLNIVYLNNGKHFGLVGTYFKHVLRQIFCIHFYVDNYLTFGCLAVGEFTHQSSNNSISSLRQIKGIASVVLQDIKTT